MEYKLLKDVAETITMPESMKQRLAENCIAAQNKTMEEPQLKKRIPFRKYAAVLAALIICMSLTVTTLAAPDRVQGIFRDVVDFRGAVVGTTYHQATDEILLDIHVQEKSLTVQAVFVNPDKAPYRDTEQLSITAYQILDHTGTAVQEGAVSGTADVINGHVAIVISIETLPAGSYRLVITEFTAEKKADQPLPITGYWSCDFTK